jgi:hypothetical protein
MMSKLKMVLVVSAAWAGTTQLALANFVPEPGSLPLVGLAIAAAIYVVHRRRK